MDNLNLALERELATIRGFASCRGDEERIDEACAELAQLRVIQDAVADLVIFVQRLARRLETAAPRNDLSQQALDYIERMGRETSPMRDCGE